jgi:uncharacterized coiled-coil protein SlyX
MLTTLKAYSTAIFLAIAFAAGASSAFYIQEHRIDKLNTVVGADKNSIASLTAGVKEQNKAIDDLNAAAAARKAASDAAVQAAKDSAKATLDRAKAILASKLPKGKNACLAASKALSDELRNERGGK